MKLVDRIDAAEAVLTPHLPTVARLIFAGTLAGYFWSSALTKTGPGPLGFLTPTDGAFVQIYPRAMEAAGYDASQLGSFAHLVVTMGTLAEFVLPLLIVLGLLTRLAALGMIGFVVVQTLTDIIGHGAAAGTWFDRASDGLIDIRALWVLLFAILVVRGGGPFALDRFLRRT